MNKELPSKWNLEDSTLYADCKIFNVNKQRFRRKSDGVYGDFFVLDSSDWVNVLAITPEDQIVLVRQFRYGTQEFSLEPPGGVIEKGENPIVAGLRELEEETGFSSNEGSLIGSARPNAAIFSNQCHFVLVKNVRKVAEIDFDQHEELVTELYPVKNLKELVTKNLITHSIGLNAILRLILHLGL